jgi:hypothetical protein
LLTANAGPGVAEGELTVHVRKSGDFTAGLNLGGKRFRLVGAFSDDGSYSTTINGGNGTPIAVSLSFTATPSLTGTVSDTAETLSYSGGLISNTSPAGGPYRFIISPGEILSSGPAPEGTGYGDMYVRTGGEVSLVGRLPDGTGFTTESAVTSGSSVPIYLHTGDSPDTGISGILVFQDIPDVSDCQGTLYWALPPRPNSHYPDGFELANQFLASQFNRVIGGLDHDVVTFSASGSDLQSTFSVDITLAPDGNLYRGDADKVHLTISRAKDRFYGSAEDPTTLVRHPFGGVLLPGSRTGAGLFFSKGISGTVTIQY